MPQITLYPTETLYALGASALDQEALKVLFDIKDRDSSQAASWLVRSLEDIKQYAIVSITAEKIAQKFLPGPLTLILPALDNVPSEFCAPDRTIGFRVSSDPVTIEVITKHMKECDQPLTCTSANLHGSPTLSTPGEILQQLGRKASLVTHVIDDGPRKSLASTIVRVAGDKVDIIREGTVSERDIILALED